MIQILIILALCIPWAMSSVSAVAVSTVHLEPFYMPNGEGYIVDLINALTGKMNLAPIFRVVPDGRFGSKQPDGWWDGMIGQVVNDTVHFAAAPITVTKERSEVVDFSYPFMAVYVLPLVKRPAPGQPLPFTNFTQYLAKVQSGEKAHGYLRGGTTAKYIADNVSPFIRQLVSTDLVDSHEEGVAKVRNSNGNYAYFAESFAMEYVSYTQPCDVMVDWTGKIGRRNYALAFPKNGRSMLKEFNKALLELEQDGTLAQLYYKWWHQRTQGQCDRPKACVCAD